MAPARPPLTEVAAPRELEQPFRRGHGRVLRLPLTRRALVLGWWEPAAEDVLAEEESDRLLEAIEGAHIPGITADDIAEWARARDWSRLELLVRRLRALLGLGAPPAPPERAVAQATLDGVTWTVVPWADSTVIDLEDARVARIAVGEDEHPSWCRCQRVCGGDQ